MRSSAWRYYVVNQLIVDGDLSRLPEGAKKVLEDEGVSVPQLIEGVKGLERFAPPDEIVQIFLSYLRLPDYAMCVSAKDGRVLTVNRVAQLVREADIPVEDCNHWAESSIVEVEYAKCLAPSIKDGVLQLGIEYKEASYDLVAAMDLAFELYCWGALNPDKKFKDFVKRVGTIVAPEEEQSFKKGFIASFVKECQEFGVHPSVFSKTVYNVSDLSKTVTVCGIPVWWATTDHTMVTALLPRGSGDKLVPARIPAAEFAQIVVSSGGASQLFVKGDKIVLEGQDA